ncbi:MAG: hypothetical protein QNJ44_21265 [Rhodobacter sp.]|nr:hypothetical protein [Rhodobacter sp.]
MTDSATVAEATDTVLVNALARILVREKLAAGGDGAPSKEAISAALKEDAPSSRAQARRVLSMLERAGYAIVAKNA